MAARPRPRKSPAKRDARAKHDNLAKRDTRAKHDNLAKRDTRQEPMPAQLYEAEVLPGLAPFAEAELAALGARILRREEDALLFERRGDPGVLLGLRRCVAVYQVLGFDVPRPKALLGHANLTRLTAAVEAVRRRYPAGDIGGFRFGAAGSESPVFRRLAEELSAATGLHQREEGELVLRVRPRPGGGWEVLLRHTPRPLSARAWRACNRPGGLNATVAAAAHDLLGVGVHDRYLNLMCGSGTLLIERALAGAWRRGVGVDLDPAAMACARENLERAYSAGADGRGAELLEADATELPFEPAAFDRLSADLPWGDVVGGHAENSVLYPRFLAEAARVADGNSRLLAITHELRLFEGALASQSVWRLSRVVRVFHGGHRPGLFLLERSG
jgi:tRNA (guanine6-N2)-methyltransferase